MGLVLTLLIIEFLDELVFGGREAAWPLIRTDLDLNYVGIGLLLGLPVVMSSLVEPLIGILGDVWNRRALVLGGGVVFALSLLVTGLSQNFLTLLLSFLMFYPASGAFVSLSQASLMDLDPARHEQNMARWTFAGAVGVVAGPLLLSAAAFAGWGWRGLFIGFCLAAVVALGLAWRPAWPRGERGEADDLRSGARQAWRALQRGAVLRWLTLLAFSDLMLDVLLGFLALYFVDVARVSEGQAALGVAVWTGASLAGDLLIIPLLERVRGLNYLRLSAGLELLIWPAFLLVPNLFGKLILLALLGLFTAGWYAILKGRLYSEMPGQSGTVLAVENIFGLIGGLLPLGLGLIAERFGLNAAMWLLILGPFALLVGVPRDVK